METLIFSLLEIPFLSRLYDEKCEIVKRGKPKPDMKDLTNVCKIGTKTVTRKFSSSRFDDIPWLTGCGISNKLYCWPCVLFNSDSSVWNREGFSDLTHMTAAAQRHEKAKKHIEAFYTLQMFGSQRINTASSNQRQAEVFRHNEKVRANREVLKTLINATCFLAGQELPFRGHDESTSSSNRGNYIELLEYTRSYDTVLNTHLQAASTFKGTSPSVQNDLIKAIADVMLDEITKEIQESQFVAIILDETSDVNTISQLSTVIRYVHKGKVLDRFLGFTDVSADGTAAGLLRHVESIVETYHLQDKLVGQTYDGASLTSGQLSGLQKRVLDKYPMALFVHCHAHGLNLVLQQGLQSIQKCCIFFKSLSALAAFFTESWKRTRALKEFVSRRLLTVAPTRWNFTSRLSNTVKENRSQLALFFDSIMEHCGNWENDDVVKARGFFHFLEEPETIFLLHVFSKVFGYTDVLYGILQNKALDVMYCKAKIDEALVFLQQERDSGFNRLWDAVISETSCCSSTDDGNENDLPKKRRRRHCSFNSETEKAINLLLFQDILDNLRLQIQQRFSTVTNFEFFQLLSCDNYVSARGDFPYDLMKKLSDIYGPTFDYSRLKSELEVVYSLEDFSRKRIHDIYEYIHENSLACAFKEVFKLSKLILTIPSSAASTERSCSALKRINRCLRSNQTQERMSSRSLLFIEKDLLLELKRKQAFYDAVIEKFIARKRRIELCYK